MKKLNNQEKFTQDHTLQQKVNTYARKGKLRRIIAILGAFVLFFTMNTLKFEADTLQRIPMCGLEEHAHTADCYAEDGTLICGLEAHEHTDACYQQRPVQPETTVFDEYMDLNSQVVLASPTTVSADDVDETVNETTAELGDDTGAAGASDNGLEVEYDLDDLYSENDADVYSDEGADVSSENGADEPSDSDIPSGFEYAVNGGTAFLSDVLRGVGLEASGILAVGEIEDYALLAQGSHIAVEPVEGVEGEFVIRVVQDFDRATLGVETTAALETIDLVNGVAQPAVDLEDEPADEEDSVDEVVGEPVEEADTETEYGRNTNETNDNSNEIIETEPKQTEVGEEETEVGGELAASVADAQDGSAEDGQDVAVGADADAQDVDAQDEDATQEDAASDAADETGEGDASDAGEDETGAQDEDAQADGEQVDGEQVDGEQADGEGAVKDADDAADDQTADDAQADGKESDGEQADGEQADGEQADGEQADGEQAGEGAVVAAERRVDLDFTDYVAADDHTVFLYDAELGAVLVNTDEVQTADGVVVTLESAADEAQDAEQDEDAPAEAEERAVLVITGDGEYEQGGVTYAVSGLVLPGETGAQADEGDGAQDEDNADDAAQDEDNADDAAQDEDNADDTAADDTAADDTAADETDDGTQSGEAVEAAERRVDLDFADYIATDEHAVYLYDASMVAVLVNTAEIDSVDGVAVGMPEAEAAGDAEPVENDADQAENVADQAGDDADNTEDDADLAENDADQAENNAEQAEAEAAAVLIITGDGEYTLNGTTYAVTGLVLPEKTVGNDNITIATANDEATLLNVAPVFEETDEDYDDIFSLFTAAKDDPTLLAKVVDLLGGVAYAEEDAEAGRELNVKVFNIALQDITTGETVEPGTELHVETSLEKPIEGEDFELYHIADGKAKLIEDAVVVEDGKAVGLNFNTVSLDKFALVYYTVNVTVEEKTITVGVDFTDVVENGVDFDSQDILTALDDGVAIDVKSLLAGETGDSLIVEATETADVDVENLAATDSEGGVAYADGAIKVTGDGSVTLTDSVYTIHIHVTNYQKLVEKVLQADGVTVEVIEGEVPAGSTVSYEALSDAHTEALVEEYREIINTSEASGDAGEAENTEEPGETGAPDEGAGEAGDAADRAAEAGEAGDAADQAAEAGDTADDDTAGEDGAEEAAEAPAADSENTVKTETATGYTAFDVSIAMPEGGAFTEGGQFAVTVDHAVDAASLAPEGAVIDSITYELFHIHNGEATQIEDVAVEDGQVSFTTDGFSEYVIRYTVEFHNGDTEVVIKGESQVLLSTLIEKLGLKRANGDTFTVDEVEKVEFVNPELFTVEEVTESPVTVNGETVELTTAHDFLLTSEQPFDADQMILTLTDGEVIGVDVTDAQSTLTTTITFFAQDAEIIGKDVYPDKPYMHIIGNTEAPTGLSSTYYVLAVLKDKQEHELGWAIQNVGTLTEAATQVSFSDFNPFETQGSEESVEDYEARKGKTIVQNSEKIYYDKDQNTISTRLYRADAPLTTLNYYQLKTNSAQNQTYTTPEDGYEYGGNFTIQDGAVNEIHVKKANNKKYKVRIYLDENAVDDIALSDNYYLYIDVTHQSGDHSYQYQQVSITAADTKNGYVEYEFPHWTDYNGNVKKATDDNNAFTGNETKIQVRLVNFENFKPNNINNATVNEEGSAIKAYQVHYATREYGTESTPTGYFEESEEVDDKTIVNCIDRIYLSTIDAEGKYNYASILGPNLPYGIVADHLFHVTHLQTNFAVNHYTGHGIDSRPDLSGKESGGAFVIAEYNYKVDDFWQNGVTNGVGAAVHENVDAGKLFVGQNLYGTVVAYVDKNSGAEGDLGNDNAKVRGNLAQTVVVETEGSDLKNNIVDPALDYMDDMSRELASHEATFVPPIPSEDGKPIIIDAMAFPEGATIFIDADAFKGKIAKTSGVEIRKKPEQVIIFNFKEEVPKGQEISFGRFVVKQEGFPVDGFATISPEDKGSDRDANPDNALMDAVARHVVWNLYNVKGTANIVTSGGMFLQPNEDSQIIIKGTTAGWISTKGYVANDGGEWHNVYSEMPSMANLKLHAYKTIDNRQPRVSQKFNFFLDEYDTTVTGDWKNLDAKLNTTGSVDFNKISEGLTDGWHVYRIHEDTSKPAETMGYYIMDGDTYYAVVRVQTVTTAGNKQATFVSEPAYYRNFTPGSFKSDSDVLTGFSEEDRVQRAVFNNEQVTKGLNILKKVQGTAATDVDFKFKVELWYQDDEGIDSPYISEDANLSTEEAQFNAVTANGTDTFTLVENLDNHSVGYVTLKAGELVTIQGINEEAHYKITEIKVGEKSITTDAYVDGYKAKTGSKEGTMSDEGEGLATVTFENEYKAEGTLDLKAHKTLTDNTGTDKQLAANMFAFRLTGPNAVNPETWLWNNAEGKVAFPQIRYTSADMEGAVPDPDNDNKLTKTLVYTVHEKHELGTGANNLAAQNVTYDDDKTVTVTLVDNGDGTITAKASIDGVPLTDLTVEFNNTYEYKVSKGFDGTKVLTGREMTDQEFWFNAVLTKYYDGTKEITYADDTAREAVDFVSATKVEGTNRANGNIVFPVITFKKAGTYTFTVTEDETRLPEDVVPTTQGQSYDVTITVTEETDSTTGEKILVAGEPTYTNNKTINNTQKKMGFTVTKEWKNVEDQAVNDGHSITFAVEKDGEAYSVTAEHVEQVAVTPGSFTVANGKVTLIADENGWPTVKIKELNYPSTAAGYVVVEDKPVASSDNADVVVKYSVNEASDADNCVAVKHDEDAVVIKNTEEDNSTNLKVTKYYVLPDGSDGNADANKSPIYFAVKLILNEEGSYWTNYNNGNATSVSSTHTAIYPITWNEQENKWNTVDIGAIPETVEINGGAATVLRYSIVETTATGEEKTADTNLLAIKYYTNYGKSNQAEFTSVAAGAGASVTIENKIPKPRKLTVTKSWIDVYGEELTDLEGKDTISFRLIHNAYGGMNYAVEDAQGNITFTNQESQATTFTLHGSIVNGKQVWDKKEFKNLPYLAYENQSASTGEYYLIETSGNGPAVKCTLDDGTVVDAAHPYDPAQSGNITITNGPSEEDREGKIKVRKVWDGVSESEKKSVSVKVYRKALAGEDPASSSKINVIAGAGYGNLVNGRIVPNLEKLTVGADVTVTASQKIGYIKDNYGNEIPHKVVNENVWRFQVPNSNIEINVEWWTNDGQSVNLTEELEDPDKVWATINLSGTSTPAWEGTATVPVKEGYVYYAREVDAENFNVSYSYTDSTGVSHSGETEMSSGINNGVITVTNTKTEEEKGALKLTKAVQVNGQTPTSAGQYALVDGNYTFTVTGPGSATTVNKAVVITINNGAVASATVDGSPVTLQEGYVVISGLSEGDYTVVEQAVTGMTTTVSVGTSTDASTRTVTVHVTPGSNISPQATVVFTNNRNTVDLNIVKVDKDDTTKSLTGAKFKVMRKDLGSTADYQVFANSAFEKNASGQSTGIVPVDDDGQITLPGLMPGEYQVSEVKAPAGYIILNSEFTFTIQTDGTVVYAGGNNMVTYTSAEHKFEVKNEPGVSLPSTGGPGTSLFYILGSILTLVAAVLLITKKRSDGAGI